MGEVCLLPTGLRCCMGQRMVLLRPDAEKVVGRYLLFALQSRTVQRQIEMHEGTGSTVSNLRIPALEALSVPYYHLPEQHRIAAVLGALDDKIELNRKMNRTLEGMAQALFKSWFIDFDGHEDLVGSELGPIPKGWASSNLGNVIDIHDNLRVPLSKKQRAERPGPYPYHGATSVMDYVDAYLFDGIYVLLGEDGSVIDEKNRPITQYVWGKFWVNNHAHVLLPKGPTGLEHLLLLLRNSNIAPFVTGAVQPKVSQRNLKKLPVVVPPAERCKQFTAAVAPLFARLRAATEQSASLTQLRDTLLPKLISGEIRVPEAEKQAEAVL
jgi:type I restriction enzyme, S subunit